MNPMMTLIIELTSMYCTDWTAIVIVSNGRETPQS